jgi:predicted RNase H-like nuclease (RuvC/YqgF family)
MNNPLAREALKRAASTVNSGVRQGVSTLIEQETATLRNRILHLERELAEMKDRIERLERDAGRR